MQAPEYSGLHAAVVAAAGPYRGYDYHGEFISIAENKLFKIPRHGSTAEVAENLFKLTPSTRTRVAADIARRDAAILRDCSLIIRSGPGSYGRRITIVGAWAPSDIGTIDTLEHVGQLPGRRMATFGGSQDPAPFEMSFPLPGNVPGVLRSRLCDVRPIFYFSVKAEAIGTVQAEGDWLTIDFECKYDSWGSF